MTPTVVGKGGDPRPCRWYAAKTSGASQLMRMKSMDYKPDPGRPEITPEAARLAISR